MALTTVSNKFVRGAPISLKSSVIFLLCNRPHRENCKNLNAAGIIGSWIRGAKWQSSTTKGHKVGMDTVTDSRVKVEIRIV